MAQTAQIRSASSTFKMCFSQFNHLSRFLLVLVTTYGLVFHQEDSLFYSSSNRVYRLLEKIETLF